MKKNVLDITIDVTNYESKVMGSTSLCIRFMGFLCCMKVIPRLMCNQCKS
jgi:hypothetical protein